jgi:hypothetical protein
VRHLVGDRGIELAPAPDRLVEGLRARLGQLLPHGGEVESVAAEVSATLAPRAISGTERMLREVTWPIAQSRPVVSIAFILLECAGS